MFRDLILTHDVFLVEDEESDDWIYDGPQFCGKDLESGGGNGHGCGEARGKGTAWRKGGERVEHVFVSWNEEIQDGYSKKHLAPFYLWCEHRDLWLIDGPSY